MKQPYIYIILLNRPEADSVYESQLEDTARYAGLLLAPAEGFGLSQNTHIRAYKPQLLVSLRFNKINNLN